MSSHEPSFPPCEDPGCETKVDHQHMIGSTVFPTVSPRIESELCDCGRPTRLCARDGEICIRMQRDKLRAEVERLNTLYETYHESAAQQTNALRAQHEVACDRLHAEVESLRVDLRAQAVIAIDAIHDADRMRPVVAAVIAARSYLPVEPAPLHSLLLEIDRYQEATR